MKRLRSMGAEETSTDEKTAKNSAKQCFWRQNDRYSSKFKLLNSKLNFKLLFALLTSNITHMKRLRSMADDEASTDEKTVKNSEKIVVLAPKLAVTAQNSNF